LIYENRKGKGGGSMNESWERKKEVFTMASGRDLKGNKGEELWPEKRGLEEKRNRR